MGNIEKLMLELIRNQLFDYKIDKEKFLCLTEDDYERLYNRSKAHDLAHLVGYALLQNDLIDRNLSVAKKFEKQYLMAVYRYENLNMESEKLKSILEDAEIPFIPLKGSVIRNDYPEPWMRTSCDIDFLVHEEDLERAKMLLVDKLEYRYEGRGTHDIQLYASSGVHLELHYSLIEDGLVNTSSKILCNVWEYCSLEKNKKYCYRMSDEMFYFYHIVHMAKHIRVGGCGIRPLMDLWLLENKIPHDDHQRNTLLEQGNILIFCNAVRKVVSVWFDDEETDESTEELSNYIILGGVYGNQKNKISVQSVIKGSKAKYIFARLFIPYESLKIQYPKLENRKWLTPYYEVCRWFRMLIKGKLQKSLDEVKSVKNLTKEESLQLSVFMDKLGL